MLQIIILILGVSFILYTILGGADFGAGIVETFAGKKGERIISKALAPVWEANHVWLILAIVILFTAFPLVYSTISVVLHIPLMIVLIGIVLRGSFFTFRHYDIGHSGTHKYYTAVFKVSSFITPVFLGVTLGAMILGKMDLVSTTGSFYEQYVQPWFNLFCLAMGLFSAFLFGYIASIFLIGETKSPIERERYLRLSRFFMLLTFVMSILVFVAAEFENHPLFDEFFSAPVSIAAFTGVLLLVPAIFYLLNHPIILFLRAAVSMQVALVIVGWFAIQYPVLLVEKNGNHLTFYNTTAPDATLFQLLIALFVGLLFVVPAFFFLFKVFKPGEDQHQVNH
ncbi:cytochrome d ubiquinol oxidase subunit II [Telluribacter sp.]|jgi:cytochrome d ubiquinol oxidase subunit II|uniref:cytochrome d ubiquinol oxidase subunit II n=1 Tax=Telluribacter sp. TaxID=1978767 RepID=UPI002E14F168|nr:cytochrome d ubiquinol oxidase subunit II [Telluribacter sp.]